MTRPQPMEVTGEQIDDTIEHLLNLAITWMLQRKCSEMEIAKVALCLRHPSAELQELMDKAHCVMSDQLSMAVAAVLNGALYPDDGEA